MGDGKGGNYMSEIVQLMQEKVQSSLTNLGTAGKYCTDQGDSLLLLYKGSAGRYVPKMRCRMAMFGSWSCGLCPDLMTSM